MVLILSSQFILSVKLESSKSIDKRMHYFWQIVVELGRGIVSLLQFDESTIPAIEPFMGESVEVDCQLEKSGFERH